MNDIDSFVERLIEEKGLEGLDSEVLAQVKSDLVGRVEDRLNVVILEQIPPSKLEKFNELLDSGDDAKTQEFIKNNVPELEALVAAELLNFRAIYLDL
jgi:hypothetical protein